jgi:beta-glucanase (GH16 family)
MSRSRAVLAALLLATGVSCGGNTGGQSGAAGAGTAGNGAAGSGGTGAGGSGGDTGAAGTSGGATATAGTSGGAGNTGGAGSGGAAGTGTGTGGGSAGTGGSSAGSGGAGRGGSAGGGAGSGGAGRGGSGGAGRGGSGGATSGSAGSGGAAGATGGSGAGGIPVPAGYRLVWSDEFDVDGRPNTANWRYEQGFVRNEEDQWYQPDNARVEGGLLIIEGRREQKANPNYQAGSSDWKRNRQYAAYTSSSLHTSGMHSWQFGRFEMRGRIPTSAGMWPAWWTLGNSGEWPSNGEIDIMEFYNGRVLFNVACGTTTQWVAKWDSVTKTLTSFNDTQWSLKFHVWRMDWDDTKIDLYLDDVLMNTTNLADMLNPNGMSPFRQPHYMLVNLAIGGINGGDPSTSTFPARYEVDYVRVFQRQ